MALGGCSTISHAWDYIFHHDDAEPVTPRSDNSWDGLGTLTVGQSGPAPSGGSAKVDSVWDSALGQTCKRLILDGGGNRLICHDDDGWYLLRDVSKNGADNLK